MQILDIVIACAGMPFDGSTKTALGGSETACREMAESLASRGHNVIVFSITDKPGNYGGVSYMHLDDWGAYVGGTPHDVSIIQRSPEMCAIKTNSSLNILWNHDLALRRSIDAARAPMWNVDKILTVSEFHKKQTVDVYELDEEIVHATRNGINFKDINKAKQIVKKKKLKRNPFKLMYSARPERGLDLMLTEVFPKLLELDSRFKLYVAGYGNKDQKMMPFYTHIDSLIASFGDRVVFLGQLPKVELYKQFLTSGVYAYPTPSAIMPNFRETSCITVMECMACELPFISSDRGALPETLMDGCGVLIEEGEGYIDKMVEMVHKTALGKMKFDFSPATEEALSWDGIAQEWEELFLDLIDDRNDNPDRLARHLLKYSDIEPLKALSKEYDLCSDVMEKLEAYKFTDDLSGFYNGLGKEWSDECFFDAKHQPRYKQLEGFVGNLQDRKLVYDFGCSYGAYLIHLANAFPDKQFLGYDFDEGAITRANELAEKFSKNGNVVFTNKHDTSQKRVADIILLNEMLEHTERPWEVINEAEGVARDGAVVYISVPYGPWEYGELDVPEHLWHLNAHDLRDMLSQKKGVTLSAMAYGTEVGALSAPLGWWLCAYEVSGAKAKPIDMGRHLRLQRPRQTVSLTMIAGPNTEEQIRWVLNSVKTLADEIIVVDCGLSETAESILLEYGATIVQGQSPREIGFDAARNIGLAHCTKDWILWLDTDERLIDPQRVHKYLRESMFNGIGISQHHFAVDTDFDPDKPIRLFRNRPCQGKDMRFWGVVHEHPELELNGGVGQTCVLSDVHIAHTGYLSESTRKGRFTRNAPLLARDIEQYPERKLQKSLIMRDNMLLARDRMRSNGAAVDPYVEKLAEEVVDLFKEHFLGQKVFAGDNPALYYSQALELLGRGISAEDIRNSGVSESLKYRYDSVEDFIADITPKLEAKAAERDHEYF